MSTSESSTDAGIQPARSGTFEQGKIYRLRYRLKHWLGKDRYAQMTYLGEGLDGATSWRGRPTIGTVTLLEDEILWSEPLPPGFVAYTCWDKRQQPW